MTNLQRQIKAEIRRIQRAAGRLESRGYSIKQVPSYSAKNASKRTLARLKKIKTKQLIERPGTTYHGAATYGEVVSGKAGKKAERSASARKGWTTRKKKNLLVALPQISVIDDIRSLIESLPDTLSYRYAGVWVESASISSDKSVMLSILETATQNPTKEIINYYLSVRGEISKLAETVQYDSDGARVEYAVGRIAELLKGAPLSTDEKYALGEYSEALDFEE